MNIDVFSDSVCPWCRIGKKNLFDAIEQWTGEPIQVHFRTYLLSPELPKEGKPFFEAMASKGSPDMIMQMLTQVTRAGEAVNIPFRFDKVERMPNTLASHQFIKSVPEEDTTRVVDAIFKAYFEDGKDIGDVEVLLGLADDLGLDVEHVREAIENERKMDEIQADIAFARENQITGVPFFVINGKLALSGAHPVENFLKAFKQVTEMEG
ncbi:DsbA family oxidoreductase [Brevibacillus invocatus]|uniref:DsbA family oxidoreductase n=1 Tax=Brevibacillus invocatus TaxID=173959 RepID=A0A3M8CI75_9BACL|nr:DsbA family oxidoreductase [Brevibacillus invocatus]MCM3077791.1 DsbA family oxidoreductase [Brevibacillus invocatus]MCM3428135.1 DsbA family oxidoreductase [Brevibacillus invocatus]RNB75251.1 DsbA family oxidoreductase [Brevibacillus invocatus]